MADDPQHEPLVGRLQAGSGAKVVIVNHADNIQMGQSAPAAPTGYVSASLPNFVGREAEIRELQERLRLPGSLVPIVGMPGLGKTYLAREFIRRHGADFEEVYRLDCEKKDLASLSVELAAQLDLPLDREPVVLARQARQSLSARRCLLFLDNVDNGEPGSLVPEGRASVLLTSRHRTIPFFADYPELTPALFRDEEALELFRRVCGVAAEEPARELFARLGHLPIAVAVAAGLIKNDVHYTVESLVEQLPSLEKLSHGQNHVGVLLRTAIESLGEKERILLQAMSACAAGGVRIGFAGEVAGLSEAEWLDALQGLYGRSLVEELDRAGRRYRVHPLLREAAGPPVEMRRRHAERVMERLEKWEAAPVEAGEFIEEAGQAVRGVWKEGDEGVVVRIANLAGNVALALGRLGEAKELYERVQEGAARTGKKEWLAAGLGNQALIMEAWGRLDEAMALLQNIEGLCLELADRAGLQASYANQAVILKAWGRLDEAMVVLQKQEAICLELGDRAGLEVSYGSQAVILQAWGRLDEAMALHKQQEAICLELGNRAGLQRSYNNQAAILHAWGWLDEAMALHKQQEAICLELGNRAGLQRSYGNQAGILQARGGLDEAMALHKQQEAICLELGDRASLGRSYGNQALILQAWGRLDEAMALLQKQQAIFLELGDRAGLEASYGNQAGILQARGRLDEAIALLQKQEAICLELGDRAGLQTSYGNQALILQAWGRLDEAMALLQKQEAICLELGDRASLAYCYWSRGLLAKAQDNAAVSREKLDLALEIFTELKMTRERDAVLLALDKGLEP